MAADIVGGGVLMLGLVLVFRLFSSSSGIVVVLMTVMMFSGMSLEMIELVVANWRMSFLFVFSKAKIEQRPTMTEMTMVIREKVLIELAERIGSFYTKLMDTQAKNCISKARQRTHSVL